jgi:hypothetical protein
MRRTANEQLREIREKKSQLDAREKAIIAREKEKSRKEDTRRKIIIGGIALKYVVDWQRLDPKDQRNFAPVESFMRTIASDPNLLDWLKSQA